jgi:site-specific DNA-methyltransferase (adenine-specific)
VSNLSACFTSNSDEWETPQNLFDELNREFNFDLDVCATSDNHKCPVYFTKEDNGLSKNWGGYRVWLNPPYSEIDKWVEKAYRETRNDNTVVVMLIPSRTDTRYFHNYIYQRTEIRFVKGRLHFNDSKGGAPFPSMIVVFRGANIK